MSVKDKIIHNINSHISRLENKLSKIYQVPETSAYFADRRKEKLDLREIIEEYEVFASIYSVVETEDIPYSATSKEYSDYLESLKSGLEILKSDKEKIESEKRKEIGNIDLLLKEFYKKKNELEQ